MRTNEQFEILLKKCNENKNSHVYLVETNSFDDTIKDIKHLIFKINLDVDNIEMLLSENSLPSLSIIYPENQEIKAESIENLIKKLQVVPNITKHNYYIIYPTENMNVKSGNSMLKVIEEPSTDSIGFFLTNNSLNVLDTIRSRCQKINLFYNIQNEVSDDIKRLSLELFNAIHIGNIDLLLNKKIVDELKDINNICTLLGEVVKLEQQFLSSCDVEFINKESKKIMLINEAINDIENNDNINLQLDKLVIESSKL